MDERDLKDKIKENKIYLTNEEQDVLYNGELGGVRYGVGVG